MRFKMVVKKATLVEVEIPDNNPELAGQIQRQFEEKDLDLDLIRQMGGRHTDEPLVSRHVHSVYYPGDAPAAQRRFKRDS